MKRWFLVILLLLILTISSIVYWSLINSSSTTSGIKDEPFNDIPPLFPQVAWEEFVESEDNKSLGEQGLYSQKGRVSSIRMNGEEWIASKNNLDRDSMDKLLESFTSYYDKGLTNSGWSNYYEDKLYNFSPLSADGPGGSIWGYIKVRDGKLRAVLLQKSPPIEDFGGRATCPCDVTFRVFVSEAVPLEELTKRVEE